MYNGWTPTPTNPERVEYDALRKEIFEARYLAFDFALVNDPDEADADKLHGFIVQALTDPAHVLNAKQEVNWKIEAEAQAADAADWKATREGDYPR